jgi:hypothetical protein
VGSLAYKKLNEETNHFLRLIVKKLPPFGATIFEVYTLLYINIGLLGDDKEGGDTPTWSERGVTMRLKELADAANDLKDVQYP